MAKKEVKRQVKRVRKYVTKWMKPLGLLWWHTNIHYVTDKKVIKKYFTRKDAAFTSVVAVVFADWRYSKATVYVNIPMVKTMDDWEVERAMVHEFVHILVNEMRAKGIDHEERVVTGLTNAFLWVEEEFR